MLKTIGVTHAVATCADCGRQFQNYKNAQALSALHAKKYHHLVLGDVCLAFEYNGRSYDPPKKRRKTP